MAGLHKERNAPKILEGIRALPWLQDARRKSPQHLECKSCLRIDKRTRQAIGCGWEEPLPSARPWAHKDMDWTPTVCPGYTCQLPEVIDVARCYMHWDRGQLQLKVPEPSASLLDAIEELKIAVGAQQLASLRSRDE